MAKNIIDTQDRSIGQDKTIVLDQNKTLDELRDEVQEIEIVSSPMFKEHAENLQFMEGIVKVRLHPSHDKNAEKIVDVYNNGTPQRFVRGMWVNCKRKYVEVLARAKPFSVSTPETSDGNGNRTTQIETDTGLRYPFDMQDNDPRGRAWLDGILQEA